MSTIRGAVVIFLAAMLTLSAGSVARAQSGKTYRVRLSPMPVDGPPMMATIAGGGTATAVLTGARLTISGTFSGLKSPATAIKIHRAIKGVRGPAVLDLPAPTSALDGQIAGSIDLTPTQIEDLGRERLYLQLDSEKAPEGNLWGWLILEEKKR